jgi:hypothetical protein
MWQIIISLVLHGSGREEEQQDERDVIAQCSMVMLALHTLSTTATAAAQEGEEDQTQR